MSLLGIDISKWQGEMDWATAWAAGANYAFIRAGSIGATTGIAYTDYQFDRNSEIAPDYMPVGFYWYFRPQHCALDQAEYFCNLIKDKRMKLPPVLDLESSWGMTAERITEAAKIFITEVYVRLDVWPLLYSRGDWLNNHTVSDDVWDFVDLWVARYADLSGPWSDGYYKPDNFDDWRFWQFSAGGNSRGKEFGAESASIDLDYFNGDQEAFDEYISKLPERVRVNYKRNAILRETPEREAMYETIAMVGEELTVIDKAVDADDREWYQTAGGLWIAVNQVEEV